MLAVELRDHGLEVGPEIRRLAVLRAEMAVAQPQSRAAEPALALLLLNELVVYNLLGHSLWHTSARGDLARAEDLERLACWSAEDLEAALIALPGDEQAAMAADLLTKLLNPLPEEREEAFSPPDMQGVLNHPFFTEGPGEQDCGQRMTQIADVASGNISGPAHDLPEAMVMRSIRLLASSTLLPIERARAQSQLVEELLMANVPTMLLLLPPKDM